MAQVAVRAATYNGRYQSMCYIEVFLWRLNPVTLSEGVWTLGIWEQHE